MAFYTIYPRDIQNICFQKRVRVVDIREPQEYRKYHYPGAVNIPYSDEDSWCCRFQSTGRCFYTVSMGVQVFLQRASWEKKGMRFIL